MITYLKREPNLTVLISASIVLHAAMLGSLELMLGGGHSKDVPQRVSIRVVEKPKEIVVEKEEPKPIPPKEIPPRTEKKPEQRKPDKAPVPEAKKIQGLTKNSVSDQGTVAAPVGNSLMVEDKGVRLSPEEIAALKRDLSSDALLIQGSFQIPEYTQAALDADLEGQFIVDVYVDAQGLVREAELRKKIGYGMDERVLEVARSAKFIPRKNEKGVPMAGWAEIKVYLELP